MAIKFQLRRGTAAEWAAADPVLMDGEPAVETDTGQIKVGDGVTQYSSLDFVVGSGASQYTDLTDATTAPLPTTNVPLSTSLATKTTKSANLSDLTSAATARTNLGIGSVDNTADEAKPVSVPTQSALDLKAPGGTLNTYAGTGRVLASTDNGNIIRCTNGSSVSMTIPSGLATGFNCVIVQGGAGVVTAVQGSGVTLTAQTELVTNGAESELLVVPTGIDAYTIYSPVSASGTMAGLSDVTTYNLAANNTSVAAVKLTADNAQVASGTAEAAVDAVASALAAGTHTNITVTYNDSTNSIDFASATGATASISGTRGTGNTLTATPAPGWTGTYQWQSYNSGWSNVGSGGTSAAHVELIADATRDIRCLFSPTNYATNILAAPSGSVGSISYVYTESPFPVDFTTGGYTDWVMDSGSASLVNFYRKGVNGVSVVDLITLTGVNLTNPAWGHAGTGNISDAGDAYDTAGTHSSAAFGHDAAGAGDAKLQLGFPASNATHHAYIYFRPDNTDAMTLRLSLSDGSASPVVITIPSLGTETGRLCTVTYYSAGSGTLTASLETGSGLSTNSYFMFDSAAYKAS